MESAEASVEIDKELYAAAVRGNIKLLEETLEDEYLLGKTFEKNNIIHIAIRHEQHDFIQASLKRLILNNHNQLIFCQKNSAGNTPFHVAAEVGNLSIVSLLYDISMEFEGDDEKEKPWRERNLKGNTAVHVAIIHDNVKVARFLLEKDPYLARIVNNSKETPLHLAIKHHVNYSESESIMAKMKQPLDKGGAALAITNTPSENMSSLINFLIEKDTSVTCWRDANGSTPLHKAATLSIPYNLQVVRSIHYFWPQSIEVCDNSGKSILHLMIGNMPNYQECKKLLNCKEFYALRNHQDYQGNTPLHIAARDLDIDMVRALLESSVKVCIKNIQGVSAASLIQQQNVLEMLRKRSMTLEESEAADRGDITFLREKMSKLGMDYFLLSQDSKGRNVLHKLFNIKKETLAMQEDFIDFIQQVLESFPALVNQTDLNGDTPVHILVRNQADNTLSESGLLAGLLELCNQCILKFRVEALWLVQNAQGNTPLHEALIANNNPLVRRLLLHDNRPAGLINKCREAPLHLLAGCPINMGEPYSKEDIEIMVKAKKEAVLWLDKEGHTPLLRAFQAGNLSTATELCTLSPEAAEICNVHGQTFWHLLVNHPSGYFVFRLLRNPGLRELLKLKDKDGNTPLHLALQGNRFDLVEDFLKIWGDERELLINKENKNQWLVELLKIQNKAGKTPADLIGESPCLPPRIERSILDNNEMIGVRSVWGIPTTEMKTYVNTIGVIAALLTTITFTAAFTVPGGLIQETGTPILIGKLAFQVFIISDIIAMCLSMMVLFCLLWIMATSNRHNSVMILDFSISLLLASFFATLLTFMAGLYATTFPVRPWIAIVTLVLCSLLMLLVHKFLVINLLIPFGKATMIFFRMFCRYVGGLFTNIVKCCSKTYPSRVRVGGYYRHRSVSYV